MKTFQLKNTAVDDMSEALRAFRRWYYGCGKGMLAVNEAGQPVALSYDEPPQAEAPCFTLAEMEEFAGEDGRVFHGMISAWEFCVFNFAPV